MRSLFQGEVAVEALCAGFGFVEGPCWGDGHLYFSDIPNSVRYAWSEASGPTVVSADTNKGNGMDIDATGALLVCEHATSVVSRFPHPNRPEGRVVVASHHGGVELNSPNDVIAAPDGSFYFTDPVYGRTSDRMGLLRPVHLDVRGVYRVRPGAPPTETELVADDFEGPNGLCFSPDRKSLYVNDTPRQHIRRFDVSDDGDVTGGDVFAEFTGESATADGFLDGMECDDAGRVWVTGPGGIWIVEPDGAKLGFLPVPEIAGSLAWGGADGRDLFVTARTTLYRTRTTVRGAHWPTSEVT